jgi:hypothetical protein
MHEAGIAVAVAAEIRDRSLDPARVRLLVRGGHGDLADFDAALRSHLEAADPGAGLGAVAIEHLATPRFCARCARAFHAVEEDAECPTCGGPGVGGHVAESIELAWDEVQESPTAGPQGPDDPPARDSWPSTPVLAGERL